MRRRLGFLVLALGALLAVFGGVRWGSASSCHEGEAGAEARSAGRCEAESYWAGVAIVGGLLAFAGLAAASRGPPEA